MTRGEVTTRPLRVEDLATVVAIHRRSFPGFFLSFLGPRFLREFYGSFLTDPQGVGFVAGDAGGELLGVVVGAVEPAGYFGRLIRRRWWAFGVASAGAVLRRPSVLPRLLRAVLYRGEAPPGGRRSLLSSIAVAPEAQGRGVGRALVAVWVTEVRRRGAGGAYLTTDACENEAANEFYRRLGWRLEREFTTPEGRRMNRYLLEWASPPEASGRREPASERDHDSPAATA